MFLMRFTERAYVHYTEDDVRRSPNQAVRLTFSNSHFAISTREGLMPLAASSPTLRKS